MVRRWARSIRMLVTSGSCWVRSMPATMSALFSLVASASASLSEAFSDKV